MKYIVRAKHVRECGEVFSPYYSNLILQISIMAQNPEKNASNDIPPPEVPNLQMQALIGEMRRMMRAECEQIHERLDRVEEGTQWRARRNRVQQRDVEGEREFEGGDLEEEFDRMSE